jgi:RNA polymerase sigma-70 factor (ECF subfamily)
MEQTAALPAALTDEPEIGALYRLYSAAVQRWAARLAGPSLDLEDVVQEVFLVAHRKLPNFRRESTPATWLFGITERVVWHKRRKERWRRWLDGSAEETAAELPATGPSPLDIAASKQATRMFYRALDGVSDRYRAVLVMFELDELSGQEIADLTGVRLPTVWVWLHRGRAQLLKRFIALEERSR